jgi:hypothetical protein
VTSVENNSINSPLPRLPAEIRNLIWQYTLDTMKFHPTKKDAPRYTENGSEVTSEFDVDRQLGFIRTCRQLYSESGLIFYHESTFSFHNYSAMARFQLSLRHAQLEAVDTIKLFGKVLEELQCRTVPAIIRDRIHRIAFCHGKDSLVIEKDDCPDPFCKAWEKAAS